jgi:hypothetical protein
MFLDDADVSHVGDSFLIPKNRNDASWNERLPAPRAFPDQIQIN